MYPDWKQIVLVKESLAKLQLKSTRTWVNANKASVFQMWPVPRAQYTTAYQP